MTPARLSVPLGHLNGKEKLGLRPVEFGKVSELMMHCKNELSYGYFTGHSPTAIFRFKCPSEHLNQQRKQLRQHKSATQQKVHSTT